MAYPLFYFRLHLSIFILFIAKCFFYFDLYFLNTWKTYVFKGQLTLSIVDGIGGDAVRIILVEDVKVLFFRQVVVVTVDVLNHLLPCGKG